MIVNTKTGVLISGTLCKDAELKYVGQNDRPVLKMSVRYASEPDETGKNRGKFIDVDIWHGAEKLDGMFSEDDSVMITTKEIKGREYNGKTYYSVSADGVYPSAQTVFRWMQQVIDMTQSAAVAQPTGLEPVGTPVRYDPTGSFEGHEFYPGEQLQDHMPSSEKRKPVQQTQSTDFIACDDEDLPF